MYIIAERGGFVKGGRMVKSDVTLRAVMVDFLRKSNLLYFFADAGFTPAGLHLTLAFRQKCGAWQV